MNPLAAVVPNELAEPNPPAAGAPNVEVPLDGVLNPLDMPPEVGGGLGGLSQPLLAAANACF
jgi:hypothetical protein